MTDEVKSADESGKIPWISTRAEVQDTYRIHAQNEEYKRALAQAMGFPPSASERKKILKELGEESCPPNHY